MSQCVCSYTEFPVSCLRCLRSDQSMEKPSGGSSEHTHADTGGTHHSGFVHLNKHKCHSVMRFYSQHMKSFIFT